MYCEFDIRLVIAKNDVENRIGGKDAKKSRIELKQMVKNDDDDIQEVEGGQKIMNECIT